VTVTTPRSPRRAPSHLTSSSKKIWRQLAEEYQLHDEPAAILVLTAAMEARDRMEQARREVAEHGMTVPTGAGGVKPAPAVGIERDARIAMVRCLRELSLGVAEGYESARPPRTGTGAFS
jgi:P27 family predicted phage terminase small subunit